MSAFECNHSNAWTGLDGCYCPDCQQTFSSGTKIYEQILKNTSRSRTREDTEPSVADNAKSSRGFDAGDRICDPKPQPTHEHNWQSNTWTSDSKAIRVCRCGATEEISDETTLERLLETLERLRQELIDLAEQSRPARAKELMRGVKDKDTQIAWVKGKLEVLFENKNPSPGASPEKEEEQSKRSLFSTSTPSCERPQTDVNTLIESIRRDGGTQPRVAINQTTVQEYAEDMHSGAVFPPVLVFFDGQEYWLADGFHRVLAAETIGLSEIATEVRQGTRRDAVLFSVGANAKHGLRRTNADKRRAVLTLLQDKEWSQWGDREIARQCGVGNQMVGQTRKSICVNHTDTKPNTERKVQRGGKTYTVNTANIGKTARTNKELQLLGNRVTVTGDHPLFPGESGTIQGLPSSDSAIVELDTGERELINVKHLKSTVAPHLKLNEGGLVQIYAPENNKINGRQGRIASIHSHTVEVWLRDVDTMTMQKHALRYQQVTPLPLEQESQLKQVCDRLNKLRERGLDPFEVEIVNLLERTLVLTPIELEYLAHIEQRHGITKGE